MKLQPRYYFPFVVFIGLALILGFRNPMAAAQEYPFRTYSIGQGLSESVVNAITQDENGYIWLATGFGLNRFDGQNFQVFLQENGLKNTKINTLLLDSKNQLWLGTGAGVYLLSINSDSIASKPELSSLSTEGIESISEDSNGRIWIGTERSGLYYWTQATGLIPVNLPSSTANEPIRKVLAIQDDYFMFSRTGVFKMSADTEEILTLTTSLRVRDALYDEQNGRIWIGTRQGLYFYEEGQIKYYDLPLEVLSLRIESLALDLDNSLWLGTEDGLHHLKGVNIISYKTEQGLSNNLINHLFFDREGILWIGTYGGGANIFLGEYVINYDISNTLTNNLVTSILEDSLGQIWVGSYGGGVQKVSLKQLRPTGRDVSTEPEIWTPLEGLPDLRVYHLNTDPNGRIWIGMRDALAYIENDRVVTIEEELFPFRKIRHIRWEDDDMWLSTYDDGLIKVNYTQLYDAETWVYERYNTDLPQWPSNTILKSIKDRSGRQWVASYMGLIEIQKDGDVKVWGLEQGLPNLSVMGVLEDDSGRIWAHTFGGLAYIENDQLTAITTEDGLPSRVSYFLHQDTQDGSEFWIGSNGGLIRYNDRTKSVTSITREEGLVSNEMNLGAFFEDSEGEFWLGSVEGLSLFNPNVYRGNEVPPTIDISEILISGAPKLKPYNEQLATSYSNNFVEIQFKGINFTAPNQISYRYRLKGLEDQWQLTRNQSVRYPSIPSGDYVFEVQSVNSNGVPSAKTASIALEVSPPYYQTYWFWLIILGVIGGVLYLIRRNSQVSKLIDMERMRVRIASDLHDDVGSSLTEIALQSDFLLAGNLQNELKESLGQIGQQCRKIVGSLDDIVWSIDARNDSMGDLTDRVQDYALAVLEARQFKITYDFEGLPMERKIPVELRENLYLIMKEALNNVVKYSDGSQVRISMRLNQDQLEARVWDNGSQLQSAKKTGHGLRNMEMRAQRMKGRLSLSNDDGFLVHVSIPV